MSTHKAILLLHSQTASDIELLVEFDWAQTKVYFDQELRRSDWSIRQRPLNARVLFSAGINSIQRFDNEMVSGAETREGFVVRTRRELNSLNQKRVLIVGLGRFGGGVGVTRWLVGEGAVVTVTDQAAESTLRESIEAVADLDVRLHLGGHSLDDLDETDLVIINPAVVKTRSEFFQEIVRREIPWTTEMNLFCERCPATVIGVTGSFGKSTTCAMLADCIRACFAKNNADGGRVHLGGNIGYSLLNDLPNIAEGDIVVLEMSNAQLEDLPRIDWAPHTAVITNLYPHHLDRHGTFEAYVAAKLNIIGPPSQTGHVIAGDLHPIAEELMTRRVHDGRVTRVGISTEKFELLVPGLHNQRNATCVLTTCQVLGLDESTVRLTLSEFRGLPHRLELVRKLDGVDYVNDSKSTAPSAIIAALECFDRPVIAIVGGQRKDFSLDECAGELSRRCRATICVGESAPQFVAALDTRRTAQDGIANSGSVHRVDTLEEAVVLARKSALAGDVVLFTPGAPSFDRYANFTQRGDHFTAIVNELHGQRSNEFPPSGNFETCAQSPASGLPNSSKAAFPNFRSESSKLVAFERKSD